MQAGQRGQKRFGPIDEQVEEMAAVASHGVRRLGVIGAGQVRPLNCMEQLGAEDAESGWRRHT